MAALEDSPPPSFLNGYEDKPQSRTLHPNRVLFFALVSVLRFSPRCSVDLHLSTASLYTHRHRSERASNTAHLGFHFLRLALRNLVTPSDV